MLDTLCALIGLTSLVLWIRTRHPFFCLPLLVAGSLLLEDDAYPFSHFPMYSDPDESENYLYLAEPSESSDKAKQVAGEWVSPLPSKTLTGITAPKIKKMYKRYLEDYAKEIDTKTKELSDEQRAKIGRQILAFFREQGEKRNSEMPEEMRLIEVWITYNTKGGGFNEVSSEIARITANQPTTAAPK